MTQYFLKNLLLGSDLTDEQMADVPYPKTELYIHVLYKTVQFGTVLGMGVFGPLVGLARGRSLSAMKSAALKGGKIGTLICIPLGPVMTETMLSKANATPESIYDRSYRIRNNIGQVRTDRFFTYGSILGAGVGVAMGAGALNGFFVGVLASTLSAGVYNNAIAPPQKKPKAEKEEKSTEPQAEKEEKS